MRLVVAWLCAVGMAFAILPLAAAEEVCSPGSLGVSRIAEIDATGGPWFGEPHGDRDFLAAGEVVLTFDDGPAPIYTRPILAALAAQCTKATFFALGEMAAEHAEVAKEIVAQGHTIGAHTWSHANLGRLSEDRAKVEIEAGFDLVEKAVGQPIAPFFRFPYLNDTPATVEYLRSRNVALFAIDIDSLDWRTHDPRSVIRRVMGGLERRGKGIILFHDIHRSTALALPELLSLLKSKGYRIVHLRPKATLQTLAQYLPSSSEPAHEKSASLRRPVRVHARRRPRARASPSW
jgi:peptidoglycan-N-acetylglucosamine deacetylase